MTVVQERKTIPGDKTKAEAFVKHVENTLGWAPFSGKHRKLIVAGVVQRRSENLQLFTWDNLYLTVEWLRVRRMTIKSPLYVFFKVEQALVKGIVPDAPSDIADLIQRAIEHEREFEREGWDDWTERLSRVTGRYRQDTYDEWVAAGRNA